MDIQIERASLTDAGALVAVQNKSFFADFQKYGVCPGYNRTVDSMRESIMVDDVYKICYDGSLIGDMIVRNNGNGKYHLGCICVVPDYENRGIGQAAMKFILACFPDALHWSLETPSDNQKNHYFYKKYGFNDTKTYKAEGVAISYFEKIIPPDSQKNPIAKPL